MSASRSRVQATPFDTAMNAEAAVSTKPTKLKATTFFGGDLPVPAARLDANKNLVTDRAFKPDTANSYIIDWASKVPYKQGGFASAGPAGRRGTAAAAADLVGSLPAKHRAGVDFMAEERVAAALAKDPQHLIDGSDAELRKSLADACREEWPAMAEAARSKYAALAAGVSGGGMRGAAAGEVWAGPLVQMTATPGDRVRYSTELAAFKTANPSYVAPRQKRAPAASEQAASDARARSRLSAARRAAASASLTRKSDPSYQAQSAAGKTGGASGEALRRSLRDVARKTGPAVATVTPLSQPPPAPLRHPSCRD
ncbi:MAG: hypothetical protein WDW38_007946 [Sanguina aurantia]